MNAQRRRLVLLRFALLLASLLATLLVAEGIARMSWQEPLEVRPEPTSELPVFESISDLAKPNLRGLHQGVLYRTNNEAIRGGAVSPFKPPGARRIAIAGDSFTMGWGVQEEDTYVVQLEDLLEESQDGHSWEVLNLGMAGYSIIGVMERLKFFAYVYQPDLLVYGFTVNDIEGPEFRESRDRDVNTAMSERTRRYLYSASYLLRYVGPRFLSLLERISPTPGSRVEELRFNYFNNEGAWATFAGALGEMGRVARKHGICGMVLVHTQLTDLGMLHPYTDVYELVAREAEERGLMAVRTFHRHRGRNETELWVSPRDPHPNRVGHRILAESLRDGILKLPESCWSDAGTGNGS